MGVIIDTSIWVSVERGRLAPADVAKFTGSEPVYIAPPVIAELEYGVQRAKTAAQRQRRASAVGSLKKKPCLIIDSETGATFGRLAADLASMGAPHRYRIQDVWIAALAIQHGLKVLTQNRRDFEGIPGLRCIHLDLSA
ncbi:MAG: PIN domain-containing protein [Verrucomicrobia bacterium]|nr:PIN domain-containing protein [Verrucomicrobiota bacterium]